MYQVIKRDGRKVDFDLSRIAKAITKAFHAAKVPYNTDIIDLLVLQVTVDRLRTADYLNTGPRSLVVFGQYASICVGVVATNDNQSLDVQFFQNFQPLVELFFCFQFGTA